GKEKPDCPPWVARGVYPDTLTKLSEALVFPRFGFALDRMADEIRGLMAQFGTRASLDTSGEISEPPAPKEPVQRVEEDKKPTPAKKKPIKKRRIKMPPRAGQKS
ncbi:MAG: hypothetical protein FJY85_18740, partial [Deltaproteobacteria bacterium]|nr:hypothetical protein [Deltaproteobacteria bacterium]